MPTLLPKHNEGRGKVKVFSQQVMGYFFRQLFKEAKLVGQFQSISATRVLTLQYFTCVHQDEVCRVVFVFHEVTGPFFVQFQVHAMLCSRALKICSRRGQRRYTSPPQKLNPLSGFDEDVDKIASFLKDRKSALVLSGAGISTESGIPVCSLWYYFVMEQDYRGPQGSYNKGHKPFTYQEFVKTKENQQR